MFSCRPQPVPEFQGSLLKPDHPTLLLNELMASFSGNSAKDSSTRSPRRQLLLPKAPYSPFSTTTTRRQRCSTMMTTTTRSTVSTVSVPAKKQATCAYQRQTACTFPTRYEERGEQACHRIYLASTYIQPPNLTFEGNFPAPIVRPSRKLPASERPLENPRRII